MSAFPKFRKLFATSAYMEVQAVWRSTMRLTSYNTGIALKLAEQHLKDKADATPSSYYAMIREARETTKLRSINLDFL